MAQCNYCKLIDEEHNGCQEKACHNQYMKFVKINKSMDINLLIQNRWTLGVRN